MGLVVMGKVWEINTKEDYDRAMETLAENEFCAEMSDDFSCWRREKDEVARQRVQVNALAREKGLIP